MTHHYHGASREAACPICKSEDIFIYAYVREFTVLKCRNCDLLWVPGVTKEQLRLLYTQSYFTSNTDYGYRDYLSDEGIIRVNARPILRKLQSLSRGSSGRKLLEVGCSCGFLLDEARKEGWQAYGVELSSDVQKYAVDKLGLNVFHGTLDEVQFEDESFDVVLIIGTIEHLNDPVATIRETRRILKKGGLLVIQTINTKGPIRLYRLIPPEHLFYFSLANLTLLLHSEGFEVVKASSCNWGKYRISEALFRFLRLILYRIGIKSSNVFLSRLPTSKLMLKVPSNEMLVISQKR